MQGKPDVYSVSNIFKGSCTEYKIISVKDIFGGGFKFASSEARNKFDIRYSELYREEDWYEYPPTQEHQKSEGKLNKDLTGEQSGGNWGENKGSKDWYQISKRAALRYRYQFIRNKQ